MAIPIKETTTLDKIRLALFSPPEERIILDEQEEQIRKRYSFILNKMIDDPTFPLSGLVNALINEFDIKKTKAYEDVKVCSVLFGNFRVATEQWSKYLVIETNKAQIARINETISKIKENYADNETGVLPIKWHKIIKEYEDVVTKCTANIGKYEQLDKIEAEKPNFDNITPPDFEATSDITKLPEFEGTPLTAEEKSKVRQKYLQNIPEAEIVK